MDMAGHGKDMHKIAGVSDRRINSKRGVVGSGSLDLNDSFEDCLSDPDLEVGFGYYAELSACKDERDFIRRVDTIISRLGFSHYSLVWLDNSDDLDSSLLITVPRDLRETYYANGLYENDMIVPYARSVECSICHSKVHDYFSRAPIDTDVTKTMRDIALLNKDFGFYDYYNVTKKSNRNVGNVMLSVAIKGHSPFEFKLVSEDRCSSLKLLCEAIDYVAVKKFPDTFLINVAKKRVVSINPKPLRVLETLANNDMNVSQVAEKLCISVVTANKHLETARKAFGARTTYAAIRRAVTNGLIDYQKD